MVFAGLVLRGSSGTMAEVILEGKYVVKTQEVRPMRMWLDHIKQQTSLDQYEKTKEDLKIVTYTET